MHDAQKLALKVMSQLKVALLIGVDLRVLMLKYQIHGN